VNANRLDSREGYPVATVQTGGNAMLIETTGACLNVHPEDHRCASYVRFGRGDITYVVAGKQRQIISLNKPHQDYTLGELQDCLAHLRYLCQQVQT